MRKLKLFMAACALFAGSTVASADTSLLKESDGWQKITAMPTNLSDYYFCIVDNSNDYMLTLSRGLSGQQTEAYNGLLYANSVNPLVDKSKLFTIEAYDGNWVMTNVEYNGYFLQTEYNAAHYYRTHDNGGGNKTWGKIKFTYTDSYWTIQNGQYPVEDGNYLGVWNDGQAPANGQGLALNKPATMKGTYQIYAITKTAANAYYDALRAGTGASEVNPLDMTGLLVNPYARFWTGSIPFGWTTTGTQNVNNGKGYDGFPGIFEFSNWGADSWTGSIKQVVTVPNGKYIVKAAFMGASGVTAYLTANSDKSSTLSHFGDTGGNINADGTETTMGDGQRGYTYLSVETKVTSGQIEIGAYAEAGGSHIWINADNFTLTYLGADLDILKESHVNALNTAKAVDQTTPMNTSVLSALQNAISNYTTVESTESALNEAINALNTATANANASIAAYASAKAYFDEAETILTGTNVYTAAAYATYYTAPKAKYEARTLTDAEAKALVKTSTGHKSANTINRVLLSSWTIGGAQCQDFDTNLYINTWSVEGNNDGSHFLTPFFEYWTNDDKSLGANTLVASVTGLKANTTYSFTIRARVRQTNSQTKIAEGITMKVGEGTAVDISAGAQFNGGQFYIGNFSAMGETDADGKLTATITVAANSNISWLSFYNCKYTEGEDLSAYIADYQFALRTATANSTSATYANVTGKEKANLTAALTTYATVDETSKAALIAAKEALETVNATFVNAVAAYNAFAELNKNVAAKLRVTLPTITETTVAADLDVESYIVDEYTAAKAYAQDFSDKLGTWTNAPGTRDDQTWSGNNADKYYDLYNSAARAMTQTVTLPAGDYALIAKGRASANGLLTVTDGTNTVTFAHKGDVGFGIATDGSATFDPSATYSNNGNGRGWEYRVLTFTSDGSTPTTLTFNMTTANNNWVGLAQGIELRCNPAALDYTELETAYNAVTVTVPTLGFEANECAPYLNVANLQNLKKAKDMLDNQDAENQTAIDNMKTTITSMTWTPNATQVNAVYDGTFAIQGENTTSPVAVAGWTGSDAGDFRQRIANTTTYPGLAGASEGVALYVWGNNVKTYKYGETVGYTMPLKANTIYDFSIKFAGWNGALDAITVSILNESTGMPATNLGKASLGINSANSLVAYNTKFATGDAGNYVLTIVPKGNAVLTDISITKAASQVLEFADGLVPTYAPGTYPAVKVSRTLTAGNWATAIYPFALSAAPGVKVAGLDDFNKTTGEVKFGSITANEANKPFLMRTDDAAAVAVVAAGLTLNNVDVEAATPVAVDKDDLSLKGVYASTDLTSDDNAKYYVLKDNKIYLVSTDADKKATINPYRAYIQLDQTSASPARELTFIVDGEITTAIEGLNVEQNENGNVYNLNGQRVEKAQKGLYIKNGKKVVVK